MPGASQTLVIIGNDPKFATVELPAFRGVYEATGMQFTRLKNPTLDQLEKHIQRLQLANKGKLPNVHFAAHMGSDGVDIQDAKLTPEKMSELFSGAPAMFLAGCESVDVADKLVSIPYVVSFIEEVSNDQSFAFALVFWTAYGYGYTGQEAYDMAREDMPRIAEFSYLHANRFLSPKGS